MGNVHRFFDDLQNSPKLFKPGQKPLGKAVIFCGKSVYISDFSAKFSALCNPEFSTLSTGFSTGKQKNTPRKHRICKGCGKKLRKNDKIWWKFFG